MNAENFGVSLISSLWACLGKSSDTKSQPQSSVKGSVAGLRLLAVTPESLWGPQRMAMHYLCKEELPLASHSTWAPAEQQAHTGFHTLLLWASGISCPTGLTPPRQGINSESDWVTGGATRQWYFKNSLTQAKTMSLVLERLKLAHWAITREGWYRCLCTQISGNGKRFISVGRVKEH